MLVLIGSRYETVDSADRPQRILCSLLINYGNADQRLLDLNRFAIIDHSDPWIAKQEQYENILNIE